MANFEVGSFVLAARVVPRANKLAVTWLGPKRVVKALSDFVDEVQDVTELYAITTHHASRLRFYQDGLRGVTEGILAHGDGGHLVKQLIKARLSTSSQKYEVVVEWVGLDPEEASWEPAEVLLQDVPVILERFVQFHPNYEVVQRMWM